MPKPLKHSVLLRKAEMRDIPLISKWSLLPDMALYLVGVPQMSKTELDQKVADQIRAMLRPYPSHLFVMAETLEGVPFGLIIYRDLDWKNRRVAVEVIIGEAEYRGKGYGGESFFAAVEYAFHELNLHKVFAYVYDFNRASLKLTRLGAGKKDVVMRKSVLRNGEHSDSIVLSILDSEFPALVRRVGLAKLMFGK